MWDIHGSRLAAHANMRFVKMRVNTYDYGETFSACLLSIKGAKLMGLSGVKTLDEAMRWCESQYTDLLRAELARVTGE